MKEIFLFQDNDIDKLQCLAIELIGRHFNFKYLVKGIEDEDEIERKDAIFDFQIVILEDDEQYYIDSLNELGLRFNIDEFNEIKPE